MKLQAAIVTGVGIAVLSGALTSGSTRAQQPVPDHKPESAANSFGNGLKKLFSETEFDPNIIKPQTTTVSVKSISFTASGKTVTAVADRIVVQGDKYLMLGSFRILTAEESYAGKDAVVTIQETRPSNATAKPHNPSPPTEIEVALRLVSKHPIDKRKVSAEAAPIASAPVSSSIGSEGERVLVVIPINN